MLKLTSMDSRVDNYIALCGRFRYQRGKKIGPFPQKACRVGTRNAVLSVLTVNAGNAPEEYRPAWA